MKRKIISIRYTVENINVFLLGPFFSIIFLFLIFTQAGLAQQYIWPTDASRLITSSFGEYREGHFHAGIDIKTWGQSGYHVFAIEKGYISRIRVSPYGYGRTVYLSLDNGLTVIYAHLSKFSEPVEKLIKAEQEKQGRFSVDKPFPPDQLPVEKGELVGFTGRSGTRDPHLHFEIRIKDNQPINPFLIGYTVDDRISPTVNAIGVSPLRYGSHVNGDFLPAIFSVKKDQNGSYRLTESIQAWGEIGFSVSAFDQANGATNTFAVYRTRLYVDDQLVFITFYNYFPYNMTQQITLDRDYRLNRWGWGLFQKLYCDIGNELPFYEPVSAGSGTLSCWEENQRELQKPLSSDYLNSDESYPIEKGSHAIRIETTDYFGNLTTVSGTLEMIPVNETNPISSPLEYFPESETIQTDSIPGTRLEKIFLDDLIRFSVRLDSTPPTFPLLYIQRNNTMKIPVPLYNKNEGLFVGSAPLYPKQDGQMFTELHTVTQQGLKYVVKDTIETFTIQPNQSDFILSDDQTFRIVFPQGSVYRSFLGSCHQTPTSHPNGVIDYDYLVYPQDIPLKGNASISIRVPSDYQNSENLGIYAIGKSGNASFLGRRSEGDMLSATTGSLGRYTVLLDTVPPEITLIQPVSEAHITDRMPLISVGFKDTLSGIYGEDHYQFYLDSIRLIVEYDPIYNLGFHQIEEQLDLGPHDLDMIITDQVGNTTRRKSRFFIDPE